jgi:hypothetical protein
LFFAPLPRRYALFERQRPKSSSVTLMIGNVDPGKSAAAVMRKIWTNLSL